MKIKENGLIFKVAYGFREKTPQHKVSLCKLFWDFILGLIVWPLAIVCMIIATLAGLLFARKVSETQGIYEPFEKWPRIGKFRIWPIWLLPTVGVAFLIEYSLPGVTLIQTPFIMFAGLFALAELTIIALLVLAAAWFVIEGILVIIKRAWGIFLRESLWMVSKEDIKESKTLFKKWMKAKKEKICPFIEIMG